MLLPGCEKQLQQQGIACDAGDESAACRRASYAMPMMYTGALFMEKASRKAGRATPIATMIILQRSHSSQVRSHRSH
eukprot:364192-Rhodomonas_salina.4